MYRKKIAKKNQYIKQRDLNGIVNQKVTNNVKKITKKKQNKTRMIT